MLTILGIDQSYSRLGISVVKGKTKDDAVLIRYKSYSFKGLKSKTEKRAFVYSLVKKAVAKYSPDYVICERIRQFSQGFVSMSYIKGTAALISRIVDAAFPQPVYSVDTRSWKSKVCGSSKGTKRADKLVSVKYIKQRYGLELNDDTCDSICIALYGLMIEQCWNKDKKRYDFFMEET